MTLDHWSHDVAVDSINDLLAVASDEGRSVTLFGLTRPGGGGTSSPTELSVIHTEDPAFVVRLDPYHHRLYVLTSDGTGGEETPMHVYDTSDPEEPAYLTTFTVPLTASLDIDPVRQLLFAYFSTLEELHIYDIGSDERLELEGSPVDLRADYPQENTWAFTAHNLTVDPWSARVFAGRTQGVLSELIAYSYDPVVPGEGTRYHQLSDMSGISMIADGLDVDVFYEDRVSLLYAYQPMPDPLTGDVYLSASAWNGSEATQVFVGYTDALALGESCGPGSGTEDLCFWRNTSDGVPSTYLNGEGVGCLDWTHHQAVGVSIDLAGDVASSFVRFEAVDATLSQSYPSDNAPHSGTYAIAAACH
jgi:hypothetical protein